MSFMIFKIDKFELYCKQGGRMAGEAALKKIAKEIAKNLTPVDKAARFADDEFAIVFPERNKKEAGAICEEIKKKISALIIDPKATKNLQKLTVSAGISENPLDGTSASDLTYKAYSQLKEQVAL